MPSSLQGPRLDKPTLPEAGALDYSELARLLVAWHHQHQRLLPWRDKAAGERSPYAVWISEIMAQQTRLETVVDYFVRWMERYPTVEALAAADQQDVLKQWEGLGYYARARNLHKAAGIVVEQHDGLLPDDRKALLALPGIGEYTVGAILSLAFNQPEPILDGNVKRVLSRLADVETPINDSATLKRLWSLAQELVESTEVGTAGSCNEAMMELGATLCTPTSPRCLICPLSSHCLALQNGTYLERPVKSPRKKTPHYDVAAGVIWQTQPYQSPLLIAQRLQDGMLGGLWEFPGGKLEPDDDDLPACLRREIDEELAMDIEVGEHVTSVDHAFTHFRITLHAYHARHVARRPQAIDCADWRWVDLDGLDEFPFGVADRRVILALRNGNDLQRNGVKNGEIK
jgi:A/G-specific adenine glycosylase